MADKVIVTNMRALKQKYGTSGVKQLQTALKSLIAADKKRGLSTSVVALDDAATMKKLKASLVKNAMSFSENKKAIDGIYRALTPDYLMILGAIDVVPHQDLTNPLYTNDPDGDNEKIAYGDLPYACDTAYSKDIKSFTGPTRVVSRLPDLTGDNKPAYLLGLLKTATNWQSAPRSTYQQYLGISAEKWRNSTAESLSNIFGNDDDLQTSPKKGYKWKSELLKRRMHFVNCHGGDTLPYFLGQSKTDDDDMPYSHKASYIAKTGITEGTVVSAECCFGAQLYDRSAEDDHQMGMSNTYLDKKAFGFFGSTTTAYGPFSGNDQADLICQYFLQRILAGASLGRAALEARQRFVEKAAPLSPMNQKTLAQFNLYGDPSIVPVETPKLNVASGAKLMSLINEKSVTGSRAAAATQEAAAVERSERREKLRAKGDLLSQLQPNMTRTDAAIPKNVRLSMQKMMEQLNCRVLDTISFAVEPILPNDVSAKGTKSLGITWSIGSKRQGTTGFHVMFGAPSSNSNMASNEVTRAGGAKAVKKGKAVNTQPVVRKFVVLEAKEVNGNIVSITEAHSK